MRVNLPVITNSYSAKNPLIQNEKTTKKADVTNGHISLKRMLEEANREKQNTPVFASNSNSIISSSMNYSEKLKAQRENAKNTSLEKKKLRYQFKDISSQIVRSKTSQVARQAVSAARRELMRLKREKQSGEYDAEEIEAAINHAKSMERVARKKVKHLEEEEMLKAAGGPCAEESIDQEEKTQEDEELTEADINEIEEDDVLAKDASIEEELSVEEMEEILSQMSEVSSGMTDSMDDAMKDMMDDMDEAMKDLMSDMGLDELADSLAAAKGDMDPEDLKMLKIKHRCKEMKEMTKADSEYLKAVFEHMEKAKSAGNIISQGNLGGFVKMNTTTGAFGDIMSINQVSVGSMEGGQPSTIDIAL